MSYVDPSEAEKTRCNNWIAAQMASDAGLALIKQYAASPIEEKLAEAIWYSTSDMLSACVPYAGPIDELCALVDGDAHAEMMNDDRGYSGMKWSLGLFMQQPIPPYRVDMLLVAVNWGLKPWRRTVVAIECDGAQWHDHDPKASQRDKVRDRALSAAGIETLRFTGSEIVRDPFECVTEIIGWLESRLGGGQP